MMMTYLILDHVYLNLIKIRVNPTLRTSHFVQIVFARSKMSVHQMAHSSAQSLSRSGRHRLRPPQSDQTACVCRWTTPDISTWMRVGRDPQPFNLYMFRGNNPVSKVHQVKEYVTGKGWTQTAETGSCSAGPGGLQRPGRLLREPVFRMQAAFKSSDL